MKYGTIITRHAIRPMAIRLEIQGRERERGMEEIDRLRERERKDKIIEIVNLFYRHAP